MAFSSIVMVSREGSIRFHASCLITLAQFYDTLSENTVDIPVKLFRVNLGLKSK